MSRVASPPASRPAFCLAVALFCGLSTTHALAAIFTRFRTLCFDPRRQGFDCRLCLSHAWRPATKSFTGPDAMYYISEQRSWLALIHAHGPGVVLLETLHASGLAASAGHTILTYGAAFLRHPVGRHSIQLWRARSPHADKAAIPVVVVTVSGVRTSHAVYLARGPPIRLVEALCARFFAAHGLAAIFSSRGTLVCNPICSLDCVIRRRWNTWRLGPQGLAAPLTRIGGVTWVWSNSAPWPARGPFLIFHETLVTWRSTTVCIQTALAQRCARFCSGGRCSGEDQGIIATLQQECRNFGLWYRKE